MFLLVSGAFASILLEAGEVLNLGKQRCSLINMYSTTLPNLKLSKPIIF